MKSKTDKALVMIELFFMYSVIGWIYEEVLEVFIYQTGFTNRGFLFGPYLPVYGAGAVIFLILLYPMKDKKKFSYGTPLAVFLGSMIIATVVELITSYGLSCFGLELWNYDHYFLNFQGRIALNPSVRFGLGGVFFLYVLQPLFERIIKKQSQKILQVVATVIAGVMLVDLVVKVAF